MLKMCVFLFVISGKDKDYIKMNETYQCCKAVILRSACVEAVVMEDSKITLDGPVLVMGISVLSVQHNFG
jgi:hypothetical protein